MQVSILVFLYTLFFWKCLEDAGGQEGSSRVAGKEPEMSVPLPSAFLMKLKNSQSSAHFTLGENLADLRLEM